MVRISLILIFLNIVILYKDLSREHLTTSHPISFSPLSLNKEMNPVKMISGQLLYLPVYSMFLTRLTPLNSI